MKFNLKEDRAIDLRIQKNNLKKFNRIANIPELAAHIQ